jgi:hypothetical protein
MKSIAMPKTVQLDEEIKMQLLHEVKETLATGIVLNFRKRFTALKETCELPVKDFADRILFTYWTRV